MSGCKITSTPTKTKQESASTAVKTPTRRKASKNRGQKHAEYSSWFCLLCRRVRAAQPGRSRRGMLVLVWRSCVRPEEEERQAALTALAAELADVLDWGTIEVKEGQALLYA